MAWPLASHFQTSLQNPRYAFRDPQLQACSFVRDALGQPRTWAGAFAVVYHAVTASGNSQAIRVFSTESPQRRERYDLIGEHLKTHKLPSLVEFEYRGDGIRSLSDGKWYPLVLMEWVQGQTLFHWVRTQCRAGESGRLARAAQQWAELIEELDDAQIAHGDLQHANILVLPSGQFRLVDYDGMCVPALAGRRNYEVGTPPYQHPQRNTETFLSPRLDDFSGLLIYVAFRALAADLQLWSRYIEQPAYDKLLFREDDFRHPQRSRLRQALQRSPDRHVHDLAGCLFTSAAGDLVSVPPLSEVLRRRQPFFVAPSTIAGAAAAAVKTPPPLWPARAVVPPPRPAAPPRRAAAPPPEPATPNLRGYTIGPCLGSGRYGTVYQATSLADGRSVAIRWLRTAPGLAAHHRQRFLRMMDPVLQLRHPQIVEMLDGGIAGKDVYLVMEHCGGGSLAQWLKQQGPLALAQARPLMLQCLDAVKYAHLHQVLHGGLKARNVFWDGSSAAPLAKIGGFALARHVEILGALGPAAIEDRLLPRERLTSDRDHRPTSDLWSLAAVFYQALTGQYPYEFGGRDPVEVILREEPLPIRQRVAAIPAGIADVIDRALRSSPAQRYRTAAEMKAALDAAFSQAEP